MRAGGWTRGRGQSLQERDSRTKRGPCMHATNERMAPQESGGGGFDDVGSDLELHSLDYNTLDGSANNTLLGKVKAGGRYVRGWSELDHGLGGWPAFARKRSGH